MSSKPQKGSHHVFRNILIILVILLLMIGGSFGFLYYTITTDDVTVDNPTAIASQAPMRAAQRFAFDAVKQTAQIKLDKSDLWWLLLPEMGEDFWNDVTKELEQFQLSLTGYGMNITEDGITIDVEAMYQSVRLPVHIQASLDFDAAGVSMSLTNAKLGPIQLPAANLLSSADTRINVDWPVITDITDVAYQQDTILLTGTLTQDMLSCVQKVCQSDAIGWFSTSHQTIFRAVRTADGFKELLPGLEQDPGSIEVLYHDLFTLASVQEYEEFMEATNNLSHRFFPGIDFDSWEEENDSVRAKWVFCDVMMDKLVTQVSIDFNNRRFSLKNGKFYLGKSVFDPLNYFTDDTTLKMQQLFHVIDADKFHLVLVGSINGYAKESPILSKVCGKQQPLTQKLDRKEAYPVGCIFQGVNGEYVLRYESMQILGTGNQVSKLLKTVVLTEAEYESLVQEGKIGVWTS